jgi:hypothetical protein
MHPRIQKAVAIAIAAAAVLFLIPILIHAAAALLIGGLALRFAFRRGRWGGGYMDGRHEAAAGQMSRPYSQQSSITPLYGTSASTGRVHAVHVA